jgi:tetratricopeptide (TPR) repeat protein
MGNAEAVEVSFLLQKGLHLSDCRDYPTAIACYDRLLELQPTFTNAWYNRGNALYALGHHNAAIAFSIA